MFIVRLVAALLLTSSLAFADEPASSPAAAASATTATTTAAATPVPDCQQGIGLLLPLNASPALARAADMVRQGAAAWSAANPGGPAIVSFPTTGEPDNVIATYGQAAAGGCRAIIGPLTRNAVTALATQNVARLPTVALNVPDSPTPANPSLRFFSLTLESEARQLAWQAFKDGRRSIAIVSTHNPVTTRAQQAFADEWKKLGGSIAHTYPASTDVSKLLGLKSALFQSPPDAILLAADRGNAVQIRPYLGLMPVYVFSSVFTSMDSPRNIDLNGARFLDMPWVLAPDNSEVQRFAHLNPSPGMEMERLYALGIDAARLASLMLAQGGIKNDAINGVTGTLRPQSDGQILRELLPASFQQNTVALQDAATP